MNKIVKKIFLAVITLILAITTFTGVTFAWLSINSDAWVEGMQIQATSGKGFLVSVDGYNYSSSLSQNQIVKAILIKYRKSYSIDEHGSLLDERNYEISENEYNQMFKDIKLDPCTSYNSNNLILKNIYGTQIDASKGKYIEFDIYFKSIGELTEDLSIYLNGLERVLHQDDQDYKVNPTKIISEKDEIKLLSDLTTFDKLTGESLIKKEKEILNVKASNALRLGIINELEETSIVELTDEDDLGSYATNILSYTDSGSEDYDVDIVYNPSYDAYKNAMFTYTSQLSDELEPIDYKKMPKTIKNLVNSQGINTVKICTLTKDESIQTATFKIWLEGWDADCIDGIKKAISVQLSFVQQ